MPSGAPLATLTGGSQFNVLLQQNLNHFYRDDPGSIIADFAQLADPTEEDFAALEGDSQVADWNAMNMITQTNFTLTVTVPNVDCEHCVLRVRYVSQNPTEDHGGSPTFHQCADITVRKSDSASATPATAPATPATPATSTNSSSAEDLGNLDCCAPKQFVLEGYETSQWRNPTHLTYYFDAESQRLRIDSDSGDGTTTKDGTHQMFNDFASGIEYYYHAAEDTCDLYGLNIWSDWCYGAYNSQTRSALPVRVGDQLADVWSMDGGNDFFWTAVRGSCTPVSKVRSGTGAGASSATAEATYYYNMRQVLPADYFDLPQACVAALDALETASSASGTDKKAAIKALPLAPAHHTTLV